MKVAIVPDYFLPHVGGMQFWSFYIAKYLGLKRHEVTIYTYKILGRPSFECYKNFKVVRVGLIPVVKQYSYVSLFLSLGMGLPRELLRSNFDVYLMTYSPLVLNSFLKKRNIFGVWHGYYGLSYSLFSKGYIKGIIRSFIESLALRSNVLGFFTVSNFLKNVLASICERVNDRIIGKIFVTYGGVEVETIDSIRNCEKKPQIVFIGRFTSLKNPFHVIYSFAKATPFIEKNIKLIMIGKGPLLSRSRELAVKLGIDRRIHFLDYLSYHMVEKFRVLKESMFLVFPSVYEAFPLTTLEALACHTPFVGYDIPALKEQVFLTKGGVLAKRNSVEDLADKIVLLCEDKNLRRRLALNGRAKVEEMFTWEKVVERIERILYQYVYS